MEWLGYWLDYEKFEIGITEKRSSWLIQWITSVLEARSSLVRNITEGLGRLAVGQRKAIVSGIKNAATKVGNTLKKTAKRLHELKKSMNNN